MPDIPIPNNETVTVMVAQTTFAVLTMPEAQFRVDFIDKAEAYLKPGMRGKFISCSEHPLLLSYNSSLVTLYINSRPQDPEKLLGEIQRRIEGVFQGWRDWRCILNGGKHHGENVLRQNLLDGSGMFLPDAPATVARAVIEACREYGAATYFQGDMENTSPINPLRHLLLIGTGYVIARDFSFVQLPRSTKIPPQSGPES
ncbi:hypothetical protein ACVWYF_002896 [Hymenobacter sp. UYAg731]